tara:strand:- start:197 stop:952 length:756 start_codon:yes stop_codon:yes gene_type:complete
MRPERAIKHIDINCDVGEGMGNEAQLFPLISSCNIACGGHFGDESSMLKVVRLAKEYGVKVGAHPSYPDREHFGRISMDIPNEVLIDTIGVQIQNLNTILGQEKMKLHHIKPHGALYNDLAKKRDLARTFLKAIMAYREDVFLYVPYGSVLEEEALSSGFQIKREAFADRNYNQDLSLVARSHANALIQEPTRVLEHLVLMAEQCEVMTITGHTVALVADTFCIHGDTPNALQILMYLSKHLPDYKIEITK